MIHHLSHHISYLLKPIDTFLNSYTMYRVVLMTLIFITVIALSATALGHFSFSIHAALLSLLICVVGSFSANIFFSKIFKAPINMESSVITGFILFFLFSPPQSTRDIYMISAAVTIAMASKYILAIQKKHIFNPAACAALGVVLLGFPGASWWVATPILFPVVTIGGLLTVRKIRRLSLLFSFVFAATISIFVTNSGFIASGVTTPFSFTREIILSWPLLFFATIMLTEPYTMPHKRWLQGMFGIIVGLLFGARFHIGPFFSTPEFALLVGNVFAFIVSPKEKLFLKLKSKSKIGKDIFEYRFNKPKHWWFQPGQYLEWTVPLDYMLPEHTPDTRGNRRYFTIASSPNESEIIIGVKVPNTVSKKKRGKQEAHDLKSNYRGPSSFKHALQSLHIGDTIVAGQQAGDFLLPREYTESKTHSIAIKNFFKPQHNSLTQIHTAPHLVFIAGGIGVTPFRSMVAYLNETLPQDIKTSRKSKKITLFYCSSSPDEFVYQDVFEKFPYIQVVYVVTRKENASKKWLAQTQSSCAGATHTVAKEVGRLSKNMLTKYLGNQTRTQNNYYLSGPNAMVETYEKLLITDSVPVRRIKKDYFPGF